MYSHFRKSFLSETFIRSRNEQNYGLCGHSEANNFTKSVFLLVLYTKTITGKDLDKYCYQLLHLSVEYEVNHLKAFCLNEIKIGIDKDPGYLEGLIANACIWNYPELNSICVDFIVLNHNTLFKIEFPFHSVGKIFILQIFRKVADWSGYRVNSFFDAVDEEIEDF
jgi:hypothetical protein